MNSRIEIFHQMERHFFSLISSKLLSLESLQACYSGVPIPALNPVFYSGKSHLLGAEIYQCKRFYESHSTPWALMVPDYLSDTKTDNVLAQSGFLSIDQGVAMYLSIRDLGVPGLESDLLIKRMDNEMETWILPTIPAFESTEDIAKIYRVRHQEAIEKSPEIYHYSGFIQEQIVSSLTLTVMGDSARIDDVATFPKHQKKGYATQLILSVLQILKDTNISWCFLEASADGLNIYKKIGFRELFKNLYYEEQCQYEQN
ncbi:TPA: GNAT family N-acetyltransferase [Legionella pneumophila]|nr:GNAT family N-acetyltransferase [Legionella pneumophila]HAU1320009.1 GNAT family N-acetyltransferase [Legionella pneumophila]HBC0467691.1 GNAT family N-acetyltransferase [Legionella pneumophila]HBD9373180.1 GNAT family N-acetyltransferase [Legionella pneumophila]HBI2945633.1 GNAT family N-acetyltransferase [Legionella pneumophila]